MSLSSIGFIRSRLRTTATIGAAIAIATVGVVRAERLMPDVSKIFACSTGKACVTGKSTGTSTWGVYGTSTNADGVHGITDSPLNSGVAGFANSSSGGHGIYGYSVAGDGVHGQTYTTSGDSGVAGLSGGTSGSGYGVYGNSSNGPGVFGTSGVTGSAGVIGQAGSDSEAYGVEATSTGPQGPALFAFAQGSGTYIATFTNQTSGKGVSCIIDPHADLSCAGSITGGDDIKVERRSGTGQPVLAYASESATPTIEDLGVGQMHEGVAYVELPSDFSSVMSHRDAYYVFLTPMGESRGLYVSMQTAAGFQVRENERGRSNVEFQFRIVAVPNGERNVRLPAAPRTPVFANPRDLRN